MFAWPGMGKLIYDSILGSDYNVALVDLDFPQAQRTAAGIAHEIAGAHVLPLNADVARQESVRAALAQTEAQLLNLSDTVSVRYFLQFEKTAGAETGLLA